MSRFLTATGRYRCDCGGALVITSDMMTGITVECCEGACGYRGKARPRLDLPLRLVPPSDCHKRKPRTTVLPMCAEGCGRAAYGPRAARCFDCKKARHSQQAMASHRRERMRIKERAALERAS